MIPDYNTYVAELGNLLVLPVTDPNFVAVLPNIIDDAEQRIYRELDLLTTIVRDTTGSLTANSRNFTFPQHFVVSESINVFTQLGITATGRKGLIPVSREWMDWIYPDETACGCCGESVPDYYAMITDQEIILGPAPDQNYQMEVVGTIRPAPLSPTNFPTYLTLYLPDLFMAESLVFGYGYLQNFGASTDNPMGSASWEQHYKNLWQSANSEELRKKYASQAWTPKQPNSIATPPRQ